MDREINLRVFCVKNKKWIEPWNFSVTGYGVVLLQIGGFKDNYYIPIDQHNYKVSIAINLIDKKGRSIYEGDIIKFDEEVLNIYETKSNFKNPFLIEFRRTNWFPFSGDVIPNSKYLQIIGNIYQNPELLMEN